MLNKKTTLAANTSTNTDTILKLIGSNKNNWPHDNETSLSHAAKHNNQKLIYEILEIKNLSELDGIPISDNKKLLIDERDLNGESAIFHAVLANQPDSLNLLLKCGANVLETNLNNQTAADISYNMGAWPCFLSLIKHGALFPREFNHKLIDKSHFELRAIIDKKNAISLIIMHDEVNEVRELIESNYISLGFSDIYNHSALMIAYLHRRIETYFLLKICGFQELSNEQPINIDCLSLIEKTTLKNLMASHWYSTQKGCLVA